MSFKEKTTIHEIINSQLMFIIYFAVKILMTHNIFVFSSELMTFQKDKKRGEEKEEEKEKMKEEEELLYVCVNGIHPTFLLSLCHLFNEKKKPLCLKLQLTNERRKKRVSDNKIFHALMHMEKISLMVLTICY